MATQTNKCLECSKVFTRPYVGGTKARYCSGTCKNKVYRRNKKTGEEVIVESQRIPVMKKMVKGKLEWISLEIQLPIYGFWDI